MSFSACAPRPSATRPCVSHRSPACQHGSHKPGESVTQCTEEPLVPSAGARKLKGAAGDPSGCSNIAQVWGWGHPATFRDGARQRGAQSQSKAEPVIKTISHWLPPELCQGSEKGGFHFPPPGWLTVITGVPLNALPLILFAEAHILKHKAGKPFLSLLRTGRIQVQWLEFIITSRNQ